MRAAIGASPGVRSGRALEHASRTAGPAMASSREVRTGSSLQGGGPQRKRGTGDAAGGDYPEGRPGGPRGPRGAGAGVQAGPAALQICRQVAAPTIGTASAGKHPRLRELGLDEPIDYRTQDFEKEVMRITGGRGVDVALDPLGEFKKSFRCLAQVGRLVMYGASNVMSGETLNPLAAVTAVARMPFFHPLKLLPDNKGIFGVNMGRLWTEADRLGAALREVMKGFAAGEFKAIVDSEVPFAE